MSDIFLTATKQRLRFPSKVGLLSVEDLWELDLTTSSPRKASLENIGADLLKKQRDLEGAGSILSTTTKSPEKDTVDLQIAILRKVAEVKQLENDARRNAAASASEKKRLLDAIAERELKELPVEELKKRVAALG